MIITSHGLREPERQVIIDRIRFWVGQKWREADKRHGRLCTVVAIDTTKERIQIEHVRKTWAQARRFHGKSGGYRLEPLEILT